MATSTPARFGNPADRSLLATQRRFLTRFKRHFTTRWNGLSWANAARTWQAAQAYFAALPVPGANNTMRTLSGRLAIPEDRLQQFITDSPWEHEAVQAQLNEDLPPAFQSPDAILQVDGMPILKDGTHSVGVGRQWAGNVGKVANSQHAVDCTLTVPGEEINGNQLTWPLGMELYLPEDWLTEPEFAARRQDVHLPDDISVRTKPEIALDLIARARTAEVPHTCIGADAEFGDSRPFRAQLREWDEPYILGVTPSELRVVPEATPIEQPEDYDGPGRPPTVPRYPEDVSATSPAAIADGLADEDWSEVSWTEGSKGDGEQSASFYRTRVRIVENTQRRAVTDERSWLLIQKRDGTIKAWLCWGVDDWSLEELVLYAHQRWTIEQFHRGCKQFFGINEFEGRTWGGWHHHVTMVLLAYAFVSLERARASATEADRLPPVSRVAEAVTRETCTQELMDERGMDRSTAEEATSTMLRVLYGKT